MPYTPPRPPVEIPTDNIGAATVVQQAATAAVVAAVANPTPATQTAVGTLQSAAQTTPGAIVTTAFTTGVTSGAGVIVGIPELPAIAWSTTVAFQIIKHISWVNQDAAKWVLLPLISAAFGYLICYLTSHGDPWIAGAKTAQSFAYGAVNAATNYKTMKPTGVFSSAAEWVGN